jgi:hypothetical protein
LLVCVAASAVAALSGAAQEVGSVDLRLPPNPLKTATQEKGKENSTAPTKQAEKSDLPSGCEKLSPGIIADGFVNTDDHRPRPILVKVSKISETNPSEGSELEAEVQIRNTGTKTIQIPWSVDPNAARLGQGPTAYEWDGGYFDVLLRIRNPNGEMLKSLSRELYGSKFQPGSLLTLLPNEWITAKIKFKLEAEYLYSEGEFEGQKGELFVRWEQVSRTMGISNCKVSNAYFRYEDFYKQEDRGITIHVAGEVPGKIDKPQKR